MEYSQMMRWETLYKHMQYCTLQFKKWQIRLWFSIGQMPLAVSFSWIQLYFFAMPTDFKECCHPLSPISFWVHMLGTLISWNQTQFLNTQNLGHSEVPSHWSPPFFFKMLLISFISLTLEYSFPFIILCFLRSWMKHWHFMPDSN